jgi:hypothetical protein
MPEARAAQIAAFLAATPAAGAERRSLAGDASLRRYDRLHLPGGGTLVLMDAPPDSGEDVRPFTRIARWLTAAGFSAPWVLAEDAEAGLLLLEDLGDDLYSTVVAKRPALEAEAYAAAVDVLAALQQEPPPQGLTRFDIPLMVDLAALAYRWYRLEVAGRAAPAEAPFRAAFAEVLEAHAGPLEAVALRDYHAQNLLWLPDRKGLARVGLLDFQDAQIGPGVYDLVSLLRDARRDVPPALAGRMIDRFVAATGRDAERTRAACAVVGVQRNLRILGVFARLSLHFRKTHYLALIPRVWTHLLADLAHPALAPVRDRLLADLPEPGPAHLRELEERCGTIPTR